MAEDETSTQGETPAPAAAITPDEVAGLKSALEKERAAAKDGRAAAKKAADLEAELTKFREASQSEQDKALTQARSEAAKEARDGLLGQVTAALVQANIRAAAGGRLNDPEDAVRLLDLAEFDLDEHFNLDAARVTKAIDQLIEAKPYLARQAEQPRSNGFDLGARRSDASKPIDDSPRSLIAAGLAASETQHRNRLT